MQRSLESIVSYHHDLVIVGGGIFGACAAWDATQRGMSVALVEKADFGGATSANSFKMAHGGIRYLQHADIARVVQSSRERAALLRVAPHLVKPLPIAVPSNGHLLKGKELLAAGVLAYDILTVGRNIGTSAKEQCIPWGRSLSRRTMVDLFPNMDHPNLSGGVIFWDGQIQNGPRLVLAFLRSAVEWGALVANYVEATGVIANGNRVTGITATDRTSGAEIQIRGTTILNTCGPWASELLRGTGCRTQISHIPFSRDAYFIIRKQLSSKIGLAVTTTTRDPDAIFSRSARHLFIVPWRGCSLVGVWHLVWEAGPEAVNVTEAELCAFLDEFNAACPGINLTLEDVVACNAGLVPFGHNKPGAQHLRYGHRSQLVDHSEEGLRGLVTLVGIRFTMARRDAARAIDLVAAQQDKCADRPPTHRLAVRGGQFERFAELESEARRCHGDKLADPALLTLLQNYGAEYTRVLRYAIANPRAYGKLGNSTVIKAEVVHAVREEMALDLSDVAFRRTDLASAGHPGRDAIAVCAELMAGERGWSTAEKDRQIATVETELGVQADDEKSRKQSIAMAM